MKTCSVPECPAFQIGRLDTCLQHEKCALAKKCTMAAGSKCEDCRRKVRPDDWVWSEPRKWQNKKKEWRFGYKHVRCEPTAPRVTKAARRESVKPLFEIANGQ